MEQMNTSSLGKPSWLNAYPNEGRLDYFGFRFYRQPLRSFLVRGAAANNFKNAKTLIYYGAIAYAFRKENGISIDADLSENSSEEWKKWFQVANYLYVVGCYSEHGSVPDSGFTGAIEESNSFFIPFIQSDENEFDLNSFRNRFYPTQREWGYLLQFWIPPLRYFRSVLEISTCTVGEYAKDCFELLSGYDNWDSLISMLRNGVIAKQGYKASSNILECFELTQQEKKLAKKMIFDEEKFTETENDEYKKNYGFIKSLLSKPFEGFQCKDKNDIAMVLCYMHLKDISSSPVDMPWKVLVSSLMFEIGICRFYTLISAQSTGDNISLITIRRAVASEINKWDDSLDPESTIMKVIESWKIKNLDSISNFQVLFECLFNYDSQINFLDGLIAGYLVSNIESDREYEYAFDTLTDEYHHFSPQAFFKERRINEGTSFFAFIEKLCLSILQEQYEFSLERMNYGQKAKFILTKSEFGDEYLYQVDNREFRENRGIVEMIGASLNLWESAGA